MINEGYNVKNYFKADANSTQKSNLSLFFSDNSLIFCEFDSDYKQIIQLTDIEFNVSNSQNLLLIDRLQFIVNNYQLIKNYDKVYISILNSKFTLIPTAFATNTADFLQFSAGLTNIKNTFEHTLSNLKFCYTFEQDIKQFLEKSFPTAFIRHAGAVTLNLFTNQPFLAVADLLLNVNYNTIEIVMKQKNNLQFYNVFNYQTTEDIIYYLLFSIEQLNLNPLTVKLSIIGQTELNDTLFSSLKKYIKYISFGSSNLIAHLKSETLPHFYFTVLNQHLCEL